MIFNNFILGDLFAQSEIPTEILEQKNFQGGLKVVVLYSFPSTKWEIA